MEILNLEKENKKNRKKIPLTNSEAFTFFFITIGFFSPNQNNDFNETEIKRFEEYGFNLKIKQARELTIFGRLFYLALIIVVIFLINY